MLKFIRKYQLFILVIGGSLLMVVFLLEPIISRMSPSQLKAKVAKLGDGTTFTRADIQEANLAISLLKRVNPRALTPLNMGGIGLDTSSESNTALHWLLLVEHAKRAGLVGGAGDGVTWVDDIAQREAIYQVQTEIQQPNSQIRTREQMEQRIAELTPQVAEVIHRNAMLAAGNTRNSVDKVYEIMAEARGIYRLIAAVRTLPSFSDVNAIHAAHGMLDAVAVNAAVLDSGIVAPTIPEPSDEQLGAFFDQYKDQNPGQNGFGIGYTQPTRLKLGWLTLDKNTFMNAVTVDRVELNKIYLQDREKYSGDFASERFEIERQYRDERATDMMVEADRVIRAQVLAKTNGLSKVNGVLTLPDDWDSRRPRLEAMAQSVVDRINDQFSVSLPTPEVTVLGDRWLNANAISSLPGFGQAGYRMGSTQLPTYALPQFFETTEPNNTGLDVQKGLPMAEPAATDQVGNRYYAIILDVRKAGPADAIADIGREQVVKDYKSVKGYELLLSHADELRMAIRENKSLAPAVDLVMAMADSADAQRPGVVRNILVRRDSIDRGALASMVDPRLNSEPFRSAVLEASSGIDPLASPDEVAADPTAVVVGLARSRAVALAITVAPRPLTAEQFRTVARGVMAQTSQRELVDAGYPQSDPFSFNSLSQRYGLTKLKEDDDSI